MMHSLLKTKSNLTLKEAILPQPPSFVKKKNYEVKKQLGEGTFGKVMVSSAHVVSDHLVVDVLPARDLACTP
jgi:calcium/calmodulin-dependent protein kinase I